MASAAAAAVSAGTLTPLTIAGVASGTSSVLTGLALTDAACSGGDKAMQLAPTFAVVIVLTIGLVVFAVWIGGGSEALRRQSGVVAVLAAVLVAIGIVILLTSEAGAPLVAVGVVTSAISASVAAALARSPSPEFASLTRWLWVISAGFGILTLVGLAVWSSSRATDTNYLNK